MSDNTETIVCIARSYEHADFVRHAIVNSFQGAWVLVSRLPATNGDIACEVYAMNERAGRLDKGQLDQIQDIVDRASEEFVASTRTREERERGTVEAKPSYPADMVTCSTIATSSIA